MIGLLVLFYVFSYMEQEIILEYLNGKTNKELSIKFGLHRTTIQRILKKNNIKLRDQSITSKKYEINEFFFRNINNQNKAYILGLIYADGNLYKNQIEITLTESDKSLLEAVGAKIYFSVPPLKWRDGRETKNRKNKPQYRLLITNKTIANDLRSIGLIENKSLKIRLPNIPENLYSHFIRGFFDGDGCLHISRYKENNRISIISNPAFLEDIKNVIEKTLKIRCYNNPKTITVNSLNIYGNLQLKKFLNWLYNDAELKLERKFKKYSDFFGN